MVFSSITFLFYFLPIFISIYYLVGRKYRNYWVLISSIVFYAWGAPNFVCIAIAVSTIDYYIVNQIYKSKVPQKKFWLTVSIILNLGLLAYFKYANFFIENVNTLLNRIGYSSITWTEIILPIGISFYIFQSITYAVDIYRNTTKPATSLLNYLMYIFLFPQLIAGPIVKFNSIAHQLENRIESTDKRLQGIYRFCIGLGKKVLIANTLAFYATQYLDGDIYVSSSTEIWLGIIAYTFQIYFDFSGYSDMAIGLGKIIGIDFPENFNSPYLSKNISEFWRRWHITLGDFMKEYLYIPLGGNRVNSKWRLYFNLWLVFLLSGLWHGASWNFIIWGLYHGTFLILDRIFLIKLLNRIGHFLSTIVTFFIVIIGWVIFRMEDFSRMKIALFKLFTIREIHWESLSLEYCVFILLAAFFSFFTISNIGKKIESLFLYNSDSRVVIHLIVAIISICLLILSVASIVASDFNPFIYYRF